jgi:alpha-beta hydrolase superfamily lysophospholipase
MRAIAQYIGMANRTYYADRAAWRRYQPHLPEAHRLTDRNLPREQAWTWHGLEVHLDRYEIADAPAVVVGLHGGGGYGRMLAPIGLFARRLGFEAVLPDLPGYGLTRVPRRRFTYETWVACACDLIAAEGRRSRRPVIALGASMGGMLAWHAGAAGAPLAGIVATTLIDPRDPVVLRALGRTRWAAPLGARMLDWVPALTDPLPVPMAYATSMQAIANDDMLTAIVRRDRLGGGRTVPARFLRTWMHYSPQREPDAVKLPLLLAHPGDDRWTPTELSERFFDTLTGPKRLVTLDNCGHFPLEEPGLTQLETAVREFAAKVIA